MYFKTLQLRILLLIISICIIRAVCSRKSTLERDISPIKINTFEAEFVSTILNPFTVKIPVNAALAISLAKNTGNTIEFYDKESGLNTVHISGGLFPNKVTYILSDRFLLLNQNGSRSRCGHLINGHGFPIEGVNIFYNEKYGSMMNATNYDDGLVLLFQPVAVMGLVPNPLFYYFESILRSGALEKPHSAVPIPTIPSFAFYDSLLISRAYFLYRGCFYNPENKKQESKALCMVTQPPYNYVSKKQFESFQNVFDYYGKPLNTIAPLNPTEGRNIEASRGIRAVVLPFGLTIYLP